MDAKKNSAPPNCAAAAKDWEAVLPTLFTCSPHKAAAERFHRAPMPAEIRPPEKCKASSSRDTVRWFLSALAPRQEQKVPALSKDLGSLSRVMRSVVQAVDDDILSEEEADAVIMFMAECFTRRRMDDVLSRITKPRSGSWFLVRSQSSWED